MKWHFGYDPPSKPEPEVVELAMLAVSEIRGAISCACEESVSRAEGSGLLRLLILESTLFAEAAEAAALASERGLFRAAFVLQRSMFEYVMLAVDYASDPVRASDRYTNLVHRAAEDERQAGGGVRKALIERQYQKYIKAGAPSRMRDESFEDVLKRRFATTSDDIALIYQRYRRPSTFCHGTLAVISDMFLPSEDSDTYSSDSLTLDGKAQLIVTVILAEQLLSTLNDALTLNATDALKSLTEQRMQITLRHNKRTQGLIQRSAE